jgi:glycopeptide antibiotics resistance protein
MWIVAIVALVVPWRSLQYHAHWDRIRWVPFVSAPVTFRDILGNVLLYLPFGYLGHSHFRRRTWLVVVAASALLSCATEFTQVFSHGRFPSVQDVMMNVAGTAMGVVLAFFNHRREARKMK